VCAVEDGQSDRQHGMGGSLALLTANEKFAMLVLDLPGRVLPSPSAGRLEIGDLLQLVGKMRQFGPAGQEVTIPPAVAEEPSVYIPVLRRRRR